MIHAQSSQYYDLIYAAQGKDYARETQVLYALIQQHKLSEGQTLLDVACGTGAHSYYLQTHFAITGVDIDADMLAVARVKCPNLEFVQGDMVDFELDKQFDILVCLFSAIGYVKTLDRLNQTLVTFKRHLRPGGLLVVEPWFYPSEFSAGYVNAIFVDQPNFKLVRMNVSDIQNGVSVLDFNYMLATPQGVERFDEHHELGLFSPDDYTNAFHAAGFDVIYDPQGLDGRGLYLGLSR
jgi:ubiquinone/menaquinone biosynthesis C-methylase UbiE